MSGKTKVTRFSVSLPQPLLEKLDEAWKNMKYECRSKAIHDALRGFISEFEWMKDEDGKVTGAIHVLYYHDKPGLLEEIINIQHRFRSVIFSTLHVHLEEDKCLEIIAVEGKVAEIKALAQAFMAKKGVKQVKVAVMAP